MDKEQKSFRPDGTVEQEATIPSNANTGQPATQRTADNGAKDETQSYTDYNGNADENAPARARE